MKKLMSNSEYHQHEAIGSTILKKIAQKSLLHALSEERKETPALVLGSAVHAAILEPETFKNDFLVAPNVDRRTKAGKETWATFQAEANGKSILTQDQMDIVTGTKEAVLSHNIARGMVSGGESEYSYFAEINGVTCKCRPDYYLPEQKCLIDLKTCQDASADGFMKACINFGYAIQAAFYLDVFNAANGTDIQEFYFVAVETSKPFAVNTFKMGEVELKLGREQYRKALEKLTNYKQDPSIAARMGYPERINEIQFPIWALEKMEA